MIMLIYMLRRAQGETEQTEATGQTEETEMTAATSAIEAQDETETEANEEDHGRLTIDPLGVIMK
jgi:hypothetical protein